MRIFDLFSPYGSLPSPPTSHQAAFTPGVPSPCKEVLLIASDGGDDPCLMRRLAGDEYILKASAVLTSLCVSVSDPYDSNSY